MADLELGELLATAVERLDAIEELAQAGADAAYALQQQAEALGERAAAEAARTEAALQEASEAADAAVTTVDTAAATLEQAFDGALEAARGLEQEGAQSADALATTVADLGTRLAAIVASLQQQVDASGSRLAGVDRHLAEMAGATEAPLRAVEQALALLASELDTSRAEFEEAREALETAFAAVEGAARSHAHDWADRLEAELAAAGQALVESSNAVIDSHNAAVAVLRDEIVDGVAAEARARFEPVREGLVGLAALCQARGPALADRAGDIEREALAVAESLRDLSAEMERTAEKLG